MSEIRELKEKMDMFLETIGRFQIEMNKRFTELESRIEKVEKTTKEILAIAKETERKLDTVRRMSAENMIDIVTLKKTV